MPQKRKGARLWLRRERRRNGRVDAATWIILDGGKHFATGCAEGEAAKAERCLAAHIAEKYQPARRHREIEDIPIADVLAIYHESARGRIASQEKFDGRIERLNEFWGAKALGEVTERSCRAYAASRGSNGGARRDLEDLRAAIKHHARQGFHRGEVIVTLPQRGSPRERWLTRDEAARLIWTCYRTREQQTVHRGPNKGQTITTAKRPLAHIARFLLIGFYTGTRAGAIASASPHKADGRSFVDLDEGIYYRLAQGRRATNKRQPPVRLPPRLLAHLQRWARNDATAASTARTAMGLPGEVPAGHFVEWRGKPVKSIKTGLKTAATLAGVDGMHPHVLRHTAATWLMQAGVGKWEAAGFLGMSVQTLERVYGHHHPDHQRDAANKIGYRPRKTETLGEPLGGATSARRHVSRVDGKSGGGRSHIRTSLWFRSLFSGENTGNKDQDKRFIYANAT